MNRFARNMLARASGGSVALSRVWPGRADRLIIAPHDLRTADATRAAMADEQFRQAFVSSGFDPFPDSTPEKTRRFVEDEIARWSPVIKSIGLKLD